MTGDSFPGVARRWLILALLVGLVVGCLGFVGWVIVDRGGRGGLTERVDALQEDAEDPVVAREELREFAEEFVVEFHTYGPDDLVDGQLTGYVDRVGALMTAKFESAFEGQIQLPQATVSQIGTKSIGAAEASGVVTMDADSAEVLVGGWVQTSYRNPSNKTKRIESDRKPLRFRVLLERIEGEWQVDELDQVGDDLPGFAEQGSSGRPSPSGQPSTPQPGDSAPASPGGTNTPGATP